MVDRWFFGFLPHKGQLRLIKCASFPFEWTHMYNIMLNLFSKQTSLRDTRIKYAT